MFDWSKPRRGTLQTPSNVVRLVYIRLLFSSKSPPRTGHGTGISQSKGGSSGRQGWVTCSNVDPKLSEGSLEAQEAWMSVKGWQILSIKYCKYFKICGFPSQLFVCCCCVKAARSNLTTNGNGYVPKKKRYLQKQVLGQIWLVGIVCHARHRWSKKMKDTKVEVRSERMPILCSTMCLPAYIYFFSFFFTTAK